MNLNTSRLSHEAIDKCSLSVDRKRFDHDTSRQIKKALKKGERNRRIIKTVIIGGYEWSYHSTRGWRKNKI